MSFSNKDDFSYLLKHTKDITKRDVYSISFTYLPAVFLSWLLLKNQKVSANHITLLGALIGTGGFISGYFFHNYQLSILLFFVFNIFDWVDGIIASNRGGSYFGIKFDTIVDRLIFSLYVIMLILYQVQIQDLENLPLLLLIFFGYYMLDVIGYASANASLAKIKNTKNIPSQSDRKINNTIKSIYFRGINWIPNRLSLPFFMLFAFFIGGISLSYLIGCTVIGTNFLKVGLESYTKRKSN